MIDDIRGDTTLTYFEFATLTALYLFSQRKLDYVILEVGLGGRMIKAEGVLSDLAYVRESGPL